MRLFLEKMFKLFLSLLSNVFLPMCISICFIVASGLVTVASNTGVDASSIVLKIREEKSILHFIGSVYNTLSIMIASCVGFVMFLKTLRTINIGGIFVDFNFHEEFFADELNEEIIVDQKKVGYLRI